MSRRESDIFDIPDEPHPDELKVFCKINALKYIWRSSLHKDGYDINLRKAIWFLRMSLDDDPREKSPKT